MASIVAFAVFLFYCLTSLPGGFYYDDLVVLKERAVTGFQLGDFFYYTLGRPLTVFTLYLNYATAGPSEIVFHVTNILIHAVNAGLCVLIAFRILHSLPAAVFAGTIFGFHFLATEPANYVWGRSSLLGTLFVLLGLLVIVGRSGALTARRVLLLAFILLLGFASRPDALLLLPLGYSAIWILEGRRWQNWYALFLALGASALAVVIVRLSDPSDATMGFDIGFSLQSWISHSLAAFLRYFELMLRPDQGSLFHVNPVLDAGTCWGVLSFSMVAAMCIWKRHDKAVLWGGLVMFLSVASVVIIPVLETVAERRVYLALLGLALLLASLLASVPSKYQVPTCIVLAVCMLVPTFLRNREWSTPPAPLKRAEQLYPEAARVQYLLGYHFESLDPAIAESHYSRAIELDPDLANVHYNLGTVLAKQGRWEEAERELLQELRGSHVGPGHPVLIPTLTNLAHIYDMLGRFRDAERLLIRVLRLQQESLEPDHPDLVPTLSSLASAYQAQSKYNEAEPLLKNSLRITQQSLGPNHPDLAAPLTRLANLYKSRAEYEKAESLLIRSLRIRQNILGPNRVEVADSLNELAGLQYSRQRYAEAATYLLRVREIRETALGPDHPRFGTHAQQPGGSLQSPRKAGKS